MGEILRKTSSSRLENRQGKEETSQRRGDRLCERSMLVKVALASSGKDCKELFFIRRFWIPAIPIVFPPLKDDVDRDVLAEDEGVPAISET